MLGNIRTDRKAKAMMANLLRRCATRYSSQPMRALLVFPLLALALFGCPPKADTNGVKQPEQPASAPAKTSTTSMKGADPSDREQVDPDGVVRRGLALSDAKALSVGEVVAQKTALAGKVIKVNGEVGKVCQAMGCWFVLKSGDDSIRITSKDHGFFVPAQCTGMSATVEGDFALEDQEASIDAAAVEMKRNG